MNSLALLTVSCLSSNLLHGYLLYDQRLERKETISHHAIKTRRTHALFIVGHVLAGTALYMFARSFFLDYTYGRLIVALFGIGFVAELVQAVIPARSTIETYHKFFAYIMAFSAILIGLLASTTIPQQPIARSVSIALALALFMCLPVSQAISQKHFWKVQMVSLAIFFANMYVIVLSSMV